MTLTECRFCVATSADPCGDDWAPGYWQGDKYHATPVCPRCAQQLLQVGAEGEWEMRARPKERSEP